MTQSPSDLLANARFEVLPFGDVEEQARRVPANRVLTVTCSPRQGIDQSLECAIRLQQAGHPTVAHLAARELRSVKHLDTILTRMARAGVVRAFVIGGDAAEPHGPFSSALAVLERLDDHPLRPQELGIGAYPEGHPLIAPEVLAASLSAKLAHADYLTTQMCFDPAVLLSWLTELRSGGVSSRVLIGIPGPVERRRLLEISMRIGVGTSLAVLRKQRGLTRLLSRPAAAAETLIDALVPSSAPFEGFHVYTFNELERSVAWLGERASAAPARRLALRGRITAGRGR